jgi:hypothetical protein
MFRFGHAHRDTDDTKSPRRDISTIQEAGILPTVRTGGRTMVRFGSARAGFILTGLLMTDTALVPPAHATSYLVDTDLGTINCIGSAGSLNGTQFVMQQSAGVTQFIFNGDLNIGTSIAAPAPAAISRPSRP